MINIGVLHRVNLERLNYYNRMNNIVPIFRPKLEDMTPFQQEYFDIFLNVATDERTAVYYPRSRGVGHTAIINSLGYHLQAMGYKVHIVSQSAELGYFAEKVHYNSEDLRGLSDNIIVLLDHFNNNFFKGDRIELEEFCKENDIILVGWFNYPEQ